ncbi:MAG: polysaccharide deacetylase family protein [Xanthomonadales bacterium]|nr:polysaccharide deacetylase family protein [Gammaproteobacteria bacterium]NNE05286.1 polysaccharide deacetylase family protein [Xanthomonadales bacterium]NNL96108.1 polysaccharide deacetylase family protein [Xanthomonadales bacterium]
MKRFAVFCLLVLAMPLSGHADACGQLDELWWMAGNWETTSPSSRVTEQWIRVSPDTAEGLGQVFDLESGAVRSSETMRLVAMSGEVFFIAKVAHNDVPVAFKLTSCEGDTAVFENPDHDFPTRIAYQLEGDDRLTADVRGPDGQGFELHFTAAPPVRPKRISLTFDDAPRADSQRFSGIERTQRLIDALEAADVPPALFFSRSKGIDVEGDARMRMYSLAGHYIGNHSHTHQRPARLGAEAYLEDVKIAHDKLVRYPTFVPLYRYPFLDEGRDVETRDRLRTGLARLGYSNGYVTVDNYDWYMDNLLQQALETGHAVDYGRLGEIYVDVMMQAVRFYDAIANDRLRLAPAHVLLLHENDLAALYIGDLVNALRNEGWTIIDALEAYQDPIASKVPDTVFNGQGRVAAIAEAQGTPRRDLVHPLEDEQALERLLETNDIFGTRAQEVIKYPK